MVGLLLLVGVGEQSLATVDFLLLLHDGAAGAAPRLAEVAAARALDVVLFADVAALHGCRDAPDAEASGSAVEHTLGGTRVISKPKSKWVV